MVPGGRKLHGSGDSVTKLQLPEKGGHPGKQKPGQSRELQKDNFAVHRIYASTSPMWVKRSLYCRSACQSALSSQTIWSG